jgi:hypothetical protein
MIRTFFLIYGIAVLGAFSLAEYRGWSLNRVDEVRNVPKSVRDNPGSYRSVYSGYHHYTGGK